MSDGFAQLPEASVRNASRDRSEAHVTTRTLSCCTNAGLEGRAVYSGGLLASSGLHLDLSLSCRWGKALCQSPFTPSSPPPRSGMILSPVQTASQLQACVQG